MAKFPLTTVRVTAITYNCLCIGSLWKGFSFRSGCCAKLQEVSLMSNGANASWRPTGQGPSAMVVPQLRRGKEPAQQ